MKLTHKKLCDIGARWLKNRAAKKCPVVFIELVTMNNEIPDVIGFTGDDSVMIEAKTSRADFKRDAEKFSRRNPNNGIGNYRFYICKEGLIKSTEIPNKWGLLYVMKNNVVKVVKSPFKGNMGRGKRFKVDEGQERNIMYSALRRVFKKESLKHFKI